MKQVLIYSSLLIVLGAGCQGLEFDSQTNFEPEIRTGIQLKTHTELSSNIDYFEYSETTSGPQTGDDFMVIYKMKQSAVNIYFANDIEMGSVLDWQKKTEADIVINGVYFHDDFLPSGQLILEGQQIGDRQFDYDKTAFIEFEPEFKILDTSYEHFNLDEIKNGAQTYPFIFKHGARAIKEDSTLKARRSFIATDLAGNIYLGVIKKSDVSLFEMMNLLENLENWDNMVNLDGGPSSGVASSYGQSLNSFTSIPNVILVNEKD